MTTTINRLWDGSNVSTRMKFNDDGSVSFRALNRQSFNISTMPPGIVLSEIPAQTVRSAVEMHETLAAITNEATSDLNLSDVGRAKKLFEPQKLALFCISQSAVDLKTFRQQIEVREAKLFAVPPANPNQAGAAIADMETRAWYANQTDDLKGKLLQQACQSLEGEAYIGALMRGPFAPWNPDVQRITQIWQNSRRTSNPTEAEAIDAQREAADWAYRQLALIASLTLALCTTWGKVDVLKLLLGTNLPAARTGYEIFGFTDKDARLAEISLRNATT